MKFNSDSSIVSLTIACALFVRNVEAFLGFVFHLCIPLSLAVTACRDQSSLWFLSLGRKRKAPHSNRWLPVSFPSPMDVTGPNDNHHSAFETQRMSTPLLCVYLACSERGSADVD